MQSSVVPAASFDVFFPYCRNRLPRSLSPIFRRIAGCYVSILEGLEAQQRREGEWHRGQYNVFAAASSMHFGPEFAD